MIGLMVVLLTSSLPMVNALLVLWAVRAILGNGYRFKSKIMLYSFRGVRHCDVARRVSLQELVIRYIIF